MSKRFVSDILKVVQVPISTLTKDTAEILRKQATYVDTDKTLNEFMVSVDTIQELAKKKSKEREELRLLLREVGNFQYVNVIAI